mmetsp:Transcript_44961/g.103956  ORF Transcript_44961/g.103956 Transcript_44961/m.103956 type:complete len:241 (-) Transcript_44961:19-741(-)
MPTLLFDNYDGCGDYILTVGNVRVQAINTLTNLAFGIAGLALHSRARTTEARQSGLLLVAVACCSAVYHATSSWGGFLLDIASMAVWASHLAGACQTVCGVLGHCCLLRTEDQRLGAGAASATLAVCAPFVAFEFFDLSPTAVWDVWANAFLLLVAMGAAPALAAMWAAGLLRRLGWLVLGALLSIFLGVIFTRLLPLLCVSGRWDAVPLHSAWHACAALSAFLTGCVVDDALVAGRRRE